MNKEELINLNGRELFERVEKSLKECNITREQANKIYEYYNKHHSENALKYGLNNDKNIM